MKIFNRHLPICIWLGVLMSTASFAPAARAAIILNPMNVSFVGGNTGTGTASAVTTTPGGSTGNTITVSKTFGTFSPNGSVSISWNWGNTTSGPTAYQVIESVTNNTGITWTDYHFGVGCGQLQQDDCGAFHPLEFDAQITPNFNDPTGPLGSFTQTLSALDWVGLAVAPGESVTFSFGIITCGPNCSGAWAFTEQPTVTVPEPATLLLVGAGLLFVVAAQRRRWRSSRLTS